METIIIYSTCPDIESARRISSALVTEKLAACVNLIDNVTSVYRWQEEIEQSSEILLVIKSTAERYQQIEKMVVELHPYEVPELLAVPVTRGLGSYLDWIKQCTK